MHTVTLASAGRFHASVLLHQPELELHLRHFRMQTTKPNSSWCLRKAVKPPDRAEPSWKYFGNLKRYHLPPTLLVFFFPDLFRSSFSMTYFLCFSNSVANLPSPPCLSLSYSAQFFLISLPSHQKLTSLTEWGIHSVLIKVEKRMGRASCYEHDRSGQPLWMSRQFSQVVITEEIHVPRECVHRITYLGSEHRQLSDTRIIDLSYVNFGILRLPTPFPDIGSSVSCRTSSLAFILFRHYLSAAKSTLIDLLLIYRGRLYSRKSASSEF